MGLQKLLYSQKVKISQARTSFYFIDILPKYCIFRLFRKVIMKLGQHRKSGQIDEAQRVGLANERTNAENSGTVKTSFSLPLLLF